MFVIVFSINYKFAPVEIREKIHFEEGDIGRVTRMLNSKESIEENVVLSTCNRTEIYVCTRNDSLAIKSISEFISEWFGLEVEKFVPFVQIEKNEKAIEHLFNVSAGLYSMVIGECQILGQVKSSFAKSQECKTSGTIFNELFKQAITFAKKVHTETELGKKAVSVSYAAVELAKKLIDDLAKKNILIVGAGEMAELAAINFASQGSFVTIANRSVGRAEKLAKKINGNHISLDELKNLDKYDLLVGSTSAREYIITEKLIRNNKKNTNPLFVIDISLPRNVEPDIKNISNVFLFDIDFLNDIVKENLSERLKIGKRISKTIELEIKKFNEWLKILEVKPIIFSLTEKANKIHQSVFSSIERKLPDLTKKEKEVIYKHTKSITNQLLREPITEIKRSGLVEDKNTLKLILKLFNIDANIKIQTTEKPKKIKNVKLKIHNHPIFEQSSTPKTYIQ